MHGRVGKQETKNKVGYGILRGKHTTKLVVEMTRSNTGDLDHKKVLFILI